MSSSCLIKPIPPLCVGAAAVSVSYSSGIALSEDVITYASTAAVYGIGKLSTQVPSFNPSWAALSAYGFNSGTVGSTWQALEYHISGGRTVGPPVSSGGAACAADSYNTADNEYTLISWEGLADNGWTGAGGYCTHTSNWSSGYVPAGGAIASPPTVINTLDASISVPATPTAGGGGGSSGGDGCNVFIGIVTQAPAGGFGVGTVQSAIFSTDGSYTTTGGAISVVFPYIS